MSFGVSTRASIITLKSGAKNIAARWNGRCATAGW
jgi:hypothetical protein